MRYSYFIPLMLFFLIGCTNNKKEKNSLPRISIYKLWEFKKMDALSSPQGELWVGRNQLDLSKADTLRFSYSSDKGPPTLYPYAIGHDTIFINNKACYKILKLTRTELFLTPIFSGSTQNVMVYEAK